MENIENKETQENINTEQSTVITDSSPSQFETRLNLTAFSQKVSEIRAEISKYIVGQQQMIDLLTITPYATILVRLATNSWWQNMNKVNTVMVFQRC